MSSAWVTLSNDLASAVDKAAKSVVAIHARPRTPSSGVVWQPGVVVTTDHTTERDDDITVSLADGRSMPATLAGRDPSTDLAVLRVAEATTEAEAADGASLKAGHLVLAVGRGPTASLGLVSSIGGPWRTWRGGHLDRFIKVDVAIYTGFSGGPLVDSAGRVAGINSSALARGLASTIPVETVNRVVAELVAKGHVSRGYLGVGMQPVRLPDSVRQKLGITGQGVIVLSVEAGSPAEQAGVLVGDVIIGLGGKPVSDTDDVQAVLGHGSAGTSAGARILRAGTMVEIAITVGERPRGL